MGIKSKIIEFTAWWHSMSELKKKPVAVPQPLHEHHICQHCGYGYDGRFCPQCGMHAEQIRFTFKRLIHNFLDIWGLGNRPMFRTIRDLFWRPGYMIRDYLGGHHLSYFPPFKMLAVLTIFIVMIAWIFNIPDDDSSAKQIAEVLLALKNKTHGFTNNVIDGIVAIVFYIGKNDLYRILTENIFVVLSAWIVFRKSGYNIVETFFSQVYINCQFHLITLLWFVFCWTIPPSEVLPYLIPLDMAILILVYDYMQFYRLKFFKALWKTLLFIFLTFILYIVFVVLLMVIIVIIDVILAVMGM